MMRSFLLAAAILAAAFLAHRWATSLDWASVWTYDVRPWIFWDGSELPAPVGDGWKVQPREVRYAAE